MKAITVRLPEDELLKLKRIKDAGFSSVAEVIKCAALSFADSQPAKRKSKHQPA